MSTELAPVTPDNLTLIAYQGRPVLTTENLAALYGTDPIRIQQNYLRNTERFEAGKHFIKLEGPELKAFKDRLSLSGSVQKNIKSLILWFDRGAARHAKILETNESWEVFEKLEDSYFDKPKTGGYSVPARLPKDEKAKLLAKIDAQRESHLELERLDYERNLIMDRMQDCIYGLEDLCNELRQKNEKLKEESEGRHRELQAEHQELMRKHISLYERLDVLQAKLAGGAA